MPLHEILQGLGKISKSLRYRVLSVLAGTYRLLLGTLSNNWYIGSFTRLRTTNKEDGTEGTVSQQ